MSVKFYSNIMTTGWNRIDEKISSLYEEMEYHPDYDIEEFKKDLQFEKDNVSIPKNLKDQTVDVSIPDHPSFSITSFRDVLEFHRSILTKLFAFTNNPDGVDTIIKYCDYYKSHYDHQRETNNIPVKMPDNAAYLLYSVLMMMAKNETTERVLDSVWELLSDYTELPPIHCLDSTNWTAPGSLAMVIMADSDLNAAVQALIRSCHTYFEVSTVLVQEPVKERLLNTMKSYKCEIDRILSNLYVFRNTTEALGNFTSKDKFKAISIWSENIIDAKKFAAKLEITTIWINAHGVLSAGLHSMIHVPAPIHRTNPRLWNSDLQEHDETLKTCVKTTKTYNHFYGGKWHSSSNGKYWTNQAGVSFAEATIIDTGNCARAARGAFKLWRSKKLSQRAKIIRSFAERLQANGEFVCANIVLQLVDRPLEIGTSLSIVRDGEAEILSTMEPVGVVLITSRDQKMLFAKLIIAVVTGNAVVIVLDSTNSVALAQYCDLLSSCGFPPGLINCLFSSSPYIIIDWKLIDEILPESSEFLDEKFTNLYKDKAYENIVYNHFFTKLTKPKSIWLQCA